MGLIAREIEAAGIPTVTVSSALSITEAVRPPRTVYVDFPLGHTAGKAHYRELQRSIVRSALALLEHQTEPGEIEILEHEWNADDSWKDAVMRPPTDDEAASHFDNRVERFPDPQYQTERDRELAEAALQSGGCPTCVFLEG